MQRDTDRLKRPLGQPRLCPPARPKRTERTERKTRNNPPRAAAAESSPNAQSALGAKAPPTSDGSYERLSGHERTCVGCRLHGDKGDMVRVVAAEDGRLALDPKARAGGRGAWVHPLRRCVEQAVRRHAAERTLKVPAQRDLDAAALLSELAGALARRLTSLLLVASRTRSLSIGTDAVEESLGRKGPRASVVLVATDAGESAQRLAAWAVAEGPKAEGRAADRAVKVVSYGTKSEIGRVFGRAEIALLAVTDARIATELAATIGRLSVLEDRV